MHNNVDIVNTQLYTSWLRWKILYYVYFTTIKSINFQRYKIYREVERLKQPHTQTESSSPTLRLPFPSVSHSRYVPGSSCSVLLLLLSFSLSPNNMYYPDISQKYILRGEKSKLQKKKNATNHNFNFKGIQSHSSFKQK